MIILTFPLEINKEDIERYLYNINFGLGMIKVTDYSNTL